MEWEQHDLGTLRRGAGGMVPDRYVLLDEGDRFVMWVNLAGMTIATGGSLSNVSIGRDFCRITHSNKCGIEAYTCMYALSFT